MLIEGLVSWTIVSAAAVPIIGAENISRPRTRAGVVTPGPEHSDTLRALLSATGADASGVDGSQSAGSAQPVVEEVTWPDGSLGCPQPGRSYTQALVPGWRIRFGSATQVLYYHASHHGQWLLCQSPPRSQPLPGPAIR